MSSDSSQPTNTPAPSTGIELSAEVNAEIEAAMKDMEAAAAAAPAPKPAAGKSPAIRGPRVVQAGREHRTGTVVSVGPTDIFIEFGPKELGVLSRQGMPEDQVPVVGSQLEVVIDKFEAAESLFICSRPGAVQKAAWEMLEAGQVIEARVTGVVNGKDGKPSGLELEVANHRAFMPASQIALERTENLSVFVGERMTCKVSRVERAGRGNIVLSRRDLLDEERKRNATKLKETLQEGQTVEGTVRKIMPFGAFVDIGGVDGLVHISDLTYDRAGFGEKAVAKYVSEGQKVSVRILKLDWENDRISLGLKQVSGDPFATAAGAIVEGAEVTGRVTKILEFGAFVEVAPGVEGLVHISELDHKRVNAVGEVLKADQVVQAKVLKVDKDTRRISLSLKALKPLPEIAIGSGGDSRTGGKGRKGPPGRSAEEIMKETPELRRLREKFKKAQFKGGLS
ncbi:MAG: S1 RNA-binding domain-containing protein [Planctomycetota bacterium]|nr:S1 RNA-binding domain-containing protein [Planctomycetota bacterium]